LDITYRTKQHFFHAKAGEGRREMIEIWKTSKPLRFMLSCDVGLGEGLMISFLIGVSDD